MSFKRPSDRGLLNDWRYCVIALAWSDSYCSRSRSTALINRNCFRGRLLPLRSFRGYHRGSLHSTPVDLSFCSQWSLFANSPVYAKQLLMQQSVQTGLIPVILASLLFTRHMLGSLISNQVRRNRTRACFLKRGMPSKRCIHSIHFCLSPVKCKHKIIV